ncbi:serine protease [Myxococcus stipitatus]|uniref:serine protease n=1 Tax=Myxococcus stipitatus TaxID=83455 RepID=UPI001E46F454|nr:serine protease [Myxococcus stipitatus]
MSGVVVAVGLLGCGGPEQDLAQGDVLGRGDQEIVGGVEARPGSHPWIVSLQQVGSHFCGGSLIRVSPTRNETDIVVTSAHCVYDGWSGLTVSAGAHDLNRPSSNQVTVAVRNVVYHSRYNPDTTMNDIAVLKLEKPIKFSSSGCGIGLTMRPNPKVQAAAGGLWVMPVCLPAAGEQVPDNMEATVAGWGLTREGGTHTLPASCCRWGSPPTINSREAAQMYSREGIVIDPAAMLAAGYKQGGKDSCQGDSGGPLVIKKGSTYVLQGIVSFGVGCARAGLPGIYTRVSNYTSWINTQVRNLSSIASM